jgi:hypothetical protein
MNLAMVITLGLAMRKMQVASSSTPCLMFFQVPGWYQGVIVACSFYDFKGVIRFVV